MNIPCALATAGVMLRSIPKRFHHLQRETWYAVAGIVAKSVRNLLSRLVVSLRWCSFVLSSHPRTIFLVDVYRVKGMHLLIRGGSRPLFVVGLITHPICQFWNF